jgi:hypothetical protein
MTDLSRGALAGGVVLLFIVLVLARRRPRSETPGRGDAAETALGAFVARAPRQASLATVMADAVETAGAAFGARKAVFFEPGLFDSWDARPLEADASVEPVSDGARAVFAWFQHNPLALVEAEILSSQFGALEQPLREVLRVWGIDAILPIVDRGQSMGILGLALGRAPGPAERDLLEYFRVVVSSAVANVRLGRESALGGTLERTTDLADAVRDALAPQADEGRAPGIAWVGHFRPAGAEASDFVTVCDRKDGGVLVVVGETLGHGLTASLASASVRSFCNALASSDPIPEPGELLEALNRALARGDRGLRAACFAAVVDGDKRRVRYAGAGHPTPYHVVRADRRLGVLRARGPLLGERADATYPTREQPLGPGDALVFVTSGVPEALDAARTPFGDRRLQQVLLTSPGEEPRATRDAILRALDRHRAEAPPLSDEAMLVLQV